MRKPDGKTKKRKPNNITRVKESEEIKFNVKQHEKEKITSFIQFNLHNLFDRAFLLSLYWKLAFLEGLSVIMGKNDTQSFDAFYGNKLMNGIDKIKRIEKEFMML